MKKKLIKGIYLTGLCLVGLGLIAVTIPKECSQQETKYLEQFQYITKREDYQKPQKGQMTFYQTNGPVAGGSVSALIIDEDRTVYAGLFGDGVYRKKADVDQWESAKTGIKDPFVLSLYKSKKGVLYAGTIRGGIFVSEDKGRTWTESNPGLTNFEVSTITEHEGDIFIGTGYGVFKSSDQGKHWTPFNKGMEKMLVKSLLVDHAGTLFAGTGGQGIFKSVDKGKTWQSINFKLQGESGLNENYIRVIVQSPKSQVLYAGTFGGGIFKSMDGGKRWLPFNAGLANTSIRSIQAGVDGTIYTGTGEGIYKSTNEGQSWISINGDLLDKNVQSMILTGENHLYMGTANGIFRKYSSETNWIPLERGISFPVVRSIIGDPEKGFYAATEGEGVFRSKDGGYTWFQMNEGLPTVNIQSIAEDHEHTLYVLTEDGVFRGDQLKKRWIPADEGIGKKGIHALFIDPGNQLFTGAEKGLFKRDYASNYWEKINLPMDNPVKWIAGDSQRLFALSSQEIFLINNGEPVPQVLNYPPHHHEIRGAFFKNNLYLWTEREIFEGKILNHDLQWKTLADLPSGVECQVVTAETVNGKEVLFAGTDKGIFLSSNLGETWSKTAGNGMLADARSFYSLYPGALLVGTGDQGVLVGLGL